MANFCRLWGLWSLSGYERMVCLFRLALLCEFNFSWTVKIAAIIEKINRSAFDLALGRGRAFSGSHVWIAQCPRHLHDIVPLRCQECGDVCQQDNSCFRRSFENDTARVPSGSAGRIDEFLAPVRLPGPSKSGRNVLGILDRRLLGHDVECRVRQMLPEVRRHILCGRFDAL